MAPCRAWGSPLPLAAPDPPSGVRFCPPRLANLKFDDDDQRVVTLGMEI